MLHKIQILVYGLRFENLYSFFNQFFDVTWPRLANLIGSVKHTIVQNVIHLSQDEFSGVVDDQRVLLHERCTISLVGRLNQILGETHYASERGQQLM